METQFQARARTGAHSSAPIAIHTGNAGEAQATCDVRPFLRPRSMRYIKAIKKLDALTSKEDHCRHNAPDSAAPQTAPDTAAAAPDADQELYKMMCQIIAQELFLMPDTALGIIAPCGLDGHHSHQIDSQGGILRHFKDGQMPSGRLSIGCQTLLEHPDAACVEVYAAHVCVISDDGSSIVLTV